MTKKDIEVKEVVLAPNSRDRDHLPYSASGYCSMIIRESWKIDLVRIKTVKKFLPTSESLVSLLKFNGWDFPHENFPEKKKINKLRCKKCDQTFDTNSDKCPKCGNEGSSYSFIYYEYELEKIPGLDAHQKAILEEFTQEPDKQDVIDLLEKLREVETLKDKVLLKRA